MDDLIWYNFVEEKDCAEEPVDLILKSKAFAVTMVNLFILRIILYHQWVKTHLFSRIVKIVQMCVKVLKISFRD